jgi:hypothetical protein
MAALLLRLCARVRSIWRALCREMGIQFTLSENQPDRPFPEGVVRLFFKGLKGTCSRFFRHGSSSIE